MVDAIGQNSKINKISRLAYNGLFRRNSVFLLGIFTTAFVFEMAFDSAADKIWDRLNQGKQWKDIQSRYAHDSQ